MSNIYQNIPLSQQKNIFQKISSWTINHKTREEGYRLKQYPSITLFSKNGKWQAFDHQPSSHNNSFGKKYGWDLLDWILQEWNKDENRVNFHNVVTMENAIEVLERLTNVKVEFPKKTYTKNYSKWEDKDIQKNFILHLRGNSVIDSDEIMDNHGLANSEHTGTELTLYAGNDANIKKMALSDARAIGNAGNNVLWVVSTSIKTIKTDIIDFNDHRVKLKNILKFRVNEKANFQARSDFNLLLKEIEERKITHVFFSNIYSFFKLDFNNAVDYGKMIRILNILRKKGIHIYGTHQCLEEWKGERDIRFIKGHGQGIKKWGTIIFARTKKFLTWIKNKNKIEKLKLKIEAQNKIKEQIEKQRKEDKKRVELLVEKVAKTVTKTGISHVTTQRDLLRNKNVLKQDFSTDYKNPLIPIVYFKTLKHINSTTNFTNTNTNTKYTNTKYTNTYNNIIYNILNYRYKGIFVDMGKKQTQAELNTLLRMYKNKKRKIYAEYNGRVTEALRNPPVDITLCVELINEERDQVIYELGVKMFPNKEIKRPKRKDRLEKYMQLAKNTQEPILWGWFRQACGFTTQGVPWGGLRVYAFSIIMAEIEKADRLKVMGKSEVDKVFELVRNISNEEESTPSAWELKQYCGEFLKTLGISQYLDKINSDRKFKLQNIENLVKEDGRALQLA